MFLVYGVWRSLVARTAGGREVAGSNPVTPIGAAAEFFKWENLLQYFFDFHLKYCKISVKRHTTGADNCRRPEYVKTGQSKYGYAGGNADEENRYVNKRR